MPVQLVPDEVVNVTPGRKLLGVFRERVGDGARRADRVLEQVESIVVEQYKKGKSAVEAREAVRKVIDEEARREGGKKEKSESG